ncbi:MAG TPA: hypothetical protein VIP56_11620 [Nitrososphaeraceae archaeon]
MKSHRASSNNNGVKTNAKSRNSTLAICNNGHDNNNTSQAERNPLFDQKLDIATEGPLII